jgi:hypothetical protein
MITPVTCGRAHLTCNARPTNVDRMWSRAPAEETVGHKPSGWICKRCAVSEDQSEHGFLLNGGHYALIVGTTAVPQCDVGPPVNTTPVST